MFLPFTIGCPKADFILKLTVEAAAEYYPLKKKFTCVKI